MVSSRFSTLRHKPATPRVCVSTKPKRAGELLFVPFNIEAEQGGGGQIYIWARDEAFQYTWPISVTLKAKYLSFKFEYGNSVHNFQTTCIAEWSMSISPYMQVHHLYEFDVIGNWHTPGSRSWQKGFYMATGPWVWPHLT